MNVNSIMRLLSLAWAVSFLVACANMQEALKTNPVESIKSWQMDGRIGVQAQSSAWQANLVWDHEESQDRLRISGPLSQGAISIIVQKDLIYLNEGNGKTELSKDPQSLLRSRLGFSVPLSSLRYWIMGVPDPSLPSRSVTGAVSSEHGFEQSGWVVLAGPDEIVGGWRLPQKLAINGAGVRLKILADNWDVKGLDHD